MSALLDLVFPSKCVVCERPPQLVCSGCLPTPRPHSELLTGYLDLAIRQHPGEPAKFLFPPSSQKNFARRGCNPFELICSKSVQLRPLKRVRARSIKLTLDQRGLSAKDRRENLEGAFEVESGYGSLLIVDDVVTTGATALSLASASAAAGYEVAGICVVARRISPSQTREVKKA